MWRQHLYRIRICRKYEQGFRRLYLERIILYPALLSSLPQPQDGIILYHTFPTPPSEMYS